MESESPIRITKEFRWEMGHRLASHTGHCRNLHGHSYRAVIALTGQPDQSGMILDFGAISQVVRPIVDELDHATMLQDTDEPLTSMLCSQGMKVVSVAFPPTTEELCRWMLARIIAQLPNPGTVQSIDLTIHETETSTVTMSQTL